MQRLCGGKLFRNEGPWAGSPRRRRNVAPGEAGEVDVCWIAHGQEAEVGRESF